MSNATAWRRALIAFALLTSLSGLASAATTTDPLLPSAEARRSEQLATEQAGFRRAETRRVVEATNAQVDASNPEVNDKALADASPASASAPSTAPLSGTTNPLSSRLPRGGIAKPKSEAGPSSLDFWLNGPVPPWTLLVGLLLGLSFLTASWALHLRAARSKKLVLDLLPVTAEKGTPLPVARPSRKEAAPDSREAQRAALPVREREQTIPQTIPAPSRDWRSDVLADVPRQFARFATIDEEPGYQEQRRESRPRHAEYEEPAVAEVRAARAPANEEQRPTFDAPEAVPQLRLLRSSVTSYGVPIPPRAERAPEPASMEPRRSSKRRSSPDAAKLSRRVSLLEGSMLQLLSSVDRLAGRVETIADSIPASKSANDVPATPRGRVNPREPMRDEQPLADAPELGPWSDPSVALPPNGRSIHPDPFFARLAADRARSREEEGVRQVQKPEPPRPPRAQTSPKPAPAATKSTPKAEPAKQGRVLDAARVRELVLKLSRHGWDAERIARESRIPARDVNLILKSAARESGSADLAEQRR